MGPSRPRPAPRRALTERAQPARSAGSSPRAGRGRARIVAATLGVAGGALVLGISAPTGARWVESARFSTVPVTAGHLDVDTVSEPTTRLYSRQPVGSRTWSSSTACTVPADLGAPYVECRLLTGAGEPIVPGDRIDQSRVVTVSATGENLRGRLRAQASTAGSLTDGFELALTAPGGTTTRATGASPEVSAAVSPGAGQRFTLVETRTTAPTDPAGTGWGTRQQGADLSGAPVTLDLDQVGP